MSDICCAKSKILNSSWTVLRNIHPFTVCQLSCKLAPPKNFRSSRVFPAARWLSGMDKRRLGMTISHLLLFVLVTVGISASSRSCNDWTPNCRKCGRVAHSLKFKAVITLSCILYFVYTVPCSNGHSSSF
jgi:hypothetical protein